MLTNTKITNPNQTNNNLISIENNLISVIIPYFNHINYIDDCLKSIRCQDYKNIEIIVVNDCSTDGSSDHLKSILKNYSFILIENKTNIGCSASIEVGFEKSKGEYICVLGSDDMWVKNRFPFQLEILINSDHEIIYGNCKMFNEKENMYFSPKLNQFQSAFKSSKEKLIDFISTQDYSLPLLQSAIFKREIFRKLQLIRRGYKSDDWVLLISSFKFFSTYFDDTEFFVYRIHQNNSHSNYWKLLPNRLEVINDFTPENLKNKAFSNILFSISDHKFSNREVLDAFKYGLASLIVDFRIKKFKILLFNFLKSFI